jgi:hypothetical protein
MDKPFYSGSNSNSNIVISFSKEPKYDFGIFAQAYRESADHLAEKFLSNIRYGYRDSDGYPIVFLYRHALELNLKNIIYKSSRLVSLRDVEKFDNTLHNRHELVDLAGKAINLLESLFLSDVDILNLCNKMKKVAMDFENIDIASFAFRYPISKKGEYSTRKHLIVSIESFYKILSPLLKDLEVVDFGLDITESQLINKITSILDPQ